MGVNVKRITMYLIAVIEKPENEPQTQVIVTGQVIVELDPVFESLHGGVGETERSVILLAQVGGLVVSCCGRHVGE